MATIHKDENSLEVHAPDAEIVAGLDEAIRRLIHFEYRIIEPVSPAVEEVSFFPMAHALNAYLGGLSTDPRSAAQHAESLERFTGKIDGHGLTPRENGHLRAAGELLSGNLSGAARILAGISGSYPLDTMALAVGHQLDLLLGDRASLRDRIGAALSSWRDSDRHYPALLGMYAFGLEENGNRDDAQEMGTRAADMDPFNVWAIHAVAHSFEMRAQCGEGVRWLDSRRDCWTRENQVRSHIWWHYSLYLLEQGDTEEILSIYDHTMAPDKIDHVPAKLANGSSMLWRLYLRGIDVGKRFAGLAQVWRPRMDLPWYAFNDMHAVMCYVGAGDLDAAADLISDRQKYVAAAARRIDNVVVTAQVGLSVCQALLAFGRGRYEEACDLLYPIRRDILHCGGSDAQRDVIQQTLLAAVTRARRRREAQTLAGEHLATRPGSRFNWLGNGALATAGDTTSPEEAM